MGAMKRMDVTLVSKVEITIEVLNIAKEHTVFQILPNGSKKEVYLNNIDLAKIIADFKES